MPAADAVRRCGAGAAAQALRMALDAPLPGQKSVFGAAPDALRGAGEEGSLAGLALRRGWARTTTAAELVAVPAEKGALRDVTVRSARRLECVGDRALRDTLVAVQERDACAAIPGSGPKACAAVDVAVATLLLIVLVRPLGTLIEAVGFAVDNCTDRRVAACHALRPAGAMTPMGGGTGGGAWEADIVLPERVARARGFAHIEVAHVGTATFALVCARAATTVQALLVARGALAIEGELEGIAAGDAFLSSGEGHARATVACGRAVAAFVGAERMAPLANAARISVLRRRIAGLDTLATSLHISTRHTLGCGCAANAATGALGVAVVADAVRVCVRLGGTGLCAVVEVGEFPARFTVGQGAIGSRAATDAQTVARKAYSAATVGHLGATFHANAIVLNMGTVKAAGPLVRTGAHASQVTALGVAHAALACRRGDALEEADVAQAAIAILMGRLAHALARDGIARCRRVDRAMLVAIAGAAALVVRRTHAVGAFDTTVALPTFCVLLARALASGHVASRARAPAGPFRSASAREACIHCRPIAVWISVVARKAVFAVGTHLVEAAEVSLSSPGRAAARLGKLEGETVGGGGAACAHAFPDRRDSSRCCVGRRCKHRRLRSPGILGWRPH